MKHVFLPTFALFAAFLISGAAFAQPDEPAIVAIDDIGNDQGRLVKITFSASGQDVVSATERVTTYEVYRRDDPAPGASTTPLLRATGWTLVGTAPAHTEAVYHLDVPTLGDSTATGVYYSVFYVRAATDNPHLFYDSAPDSGYSIDNLAPGVPGGLMYADGRLTWEESRAPDFSHFTVYGGKTDAPRDATVIGQCFQPDFVVCPCHTWLLVTATDVSGNESTPAVMRARIDDTPHRALAIASHPNPFNPRTAIQYTVPARGQVTVAIYDARGTLVRALVIEEPRDAGTYVAEWDGRGVHGENLSSGVYFARMKFGSAVQTTKLVLLK